LIFQKQSFSIENEKYIKFSLGQKMKHTLLSKNPPKDSEDSKDPKYDGFIRFKIPKHIFEKRYAIKEIEITPSKDRSVCYINYKFEIDIPEISEDILSKKIVSVDFGMVNLMTVFSLAFDNPLIYKGGYVLFVNKTYKKVIEGIYQPAYDKEQDRDKKKHINDHIMKLWRRRELKIKDHFNKVSCDFINRCVEAGIEEIILGYNPNWKQEVNMGADTNDAFYKIPYRNLINMIFNKAQEHGIKVREVKESYTSISDAVNWEQIGPHKRYSGKRDKRGLFSSGKHVYVNADVNGAINIMRKGIYDSEDLLEELEEFLCMYRKICNPIVIKLKEEHNNNKKLDPKRKAAYIIKEWQLKEKYVKKVNARKKSEKKKERSILYRISGRPK